jgi:hypothetical protein
MQKRQPLPSGIRKDSLFIQSPNMPQFSIEGAEIAVAILWSSSMVVSTFIKLSP